MTTDEYPLLSPFLLTSKTVLVTGGMGGIGQACVSLLQRYGANVAYTYFSGKNGSSGEGDAPVDRSIDSVDPDRSSVHPLDLRSTASIQECLDTVHSRWGSVDILVNNAAVGSATVAALSDDQAEQDTQMFAINADGTLKMCQRFLAAKPIDPPGGSHRKIINISSVGGGVAVFPSFRVSDGMSKAAVAFLTRQLAAEQVHTNVDVFAICPGATDTSMFRASTLSSMSDDQETAYRTKLPKQRLIEPGEIAAIVHFLASDQSTPLHGAVIDASMGLGVRPGLALPDDPL